MSRVFSPLVVLVVLAACGAPVEPGESPDAGGTPPDAGDPSVPDAGEAPGSPNLAANGTWQLSGAEAAGCGMVLSSGFTGVAIDGTTHEFRLTLKSTFNGQTVRLDCVLGDTTKFTCDDYSVGMTFSGCQASGGLRDVSGHLNGATVDLEGQVHSTGTGTCPPTVQCGPRNLLASGSVVSP